MEEVAQLQALPHRSQPPAVYVHQRRTALGSPSGRDQHGIRGVGSMINPAAIARGWRHCRLVALLASVGLWLACSGAQITPKEQAAHSKAAPTYAGGGHVVSVLSPKRVVINRGRLDGLSADAKKLALFPVRRDPRSSNNNTELDSDLLLARGAVVELRPDTAIVELSAVASAVAVGDFLEVQVPMPAVLAGDALFELAAMDIELRTLAQDAPIYRLSDLLQDPTQQRKDQILQLILKEIQAQTALAGEVFTARIEGGRFHGMKLQEAFAKTTTEDLQVFLMFVRAFPGKYIAHRWKLAEVYATWIINRAPDGDRERRVRQAAAPIQRGITMAQAGDFGGAEIAWREALKLVPDDDTLKKRLKALEDIRLRRAALARDPDDTATRWSLLALLFDRSAYQECAKELDVLERQKYNPQEVKRYRAMLLAREEKYAAAAVLLREVVAAGKNASAELWLVYCDKMAAASGDPQSFGAQIALARVQEGNGSYDEAMQRYRSAQELAASPAQMEEVRVGQERVGVQREIDRLAIWVDSDIEKHAMSSAEKRVSQVLQLCQKLGDTPKAVKLLKRFAETAYAQWEEQALLRWRQRQLRLTPEDVEARLAMAWTLYQRGDLNAALHHVDQALRVDPKRHYAFQIRARVYLQQGQLAQAEEAARTACEDPNYAWPQATLARVLAAQGNWPQAVAAAERAWKMMPEESELQEARRAARMALKASVAIADGKDVERERLRMVRALVALELPDAASAEAARMTVDQPLWKQARKAIAENASRAFDRALVRQAWVDFGGTDLRSVRQLELAEAQLAYRDQPRVTGHSLRLAKALVALGRFHEALVLVGAATPGTPAADVAEAARLGNEADTAHGLGIEARAASDAETAERLHRQARQVYLRIGSTRASTMLWYIAVAMWSQGNSDQALAFLKENRAEAVASGDGSSVREVDLLTADLEGNKGALQAKRVALEKGVDHCLAEDSDYCLAQLYNGLGDVALTEGRLQDAEKLLESSLEHADRCGLGRLVRAGRGTLADIHLVAGHYPAVQRIAEDLLVQSRKVKDSDNERMALMLLGATAMRRGDVSLATQRFGEVYEVGRRAGNSWVRAMARLFEGRAWLDAGHEPAKAAPLLAQATELYGALNDATSQGRAMLALAEAEVKLGKLDQARQHLANALELARRVSARGLTARVLIEQASQSLAQGKSAVALTMAAEATALTEVAEVAEDRWRAQHMFAQTLDAEHREDRAFAAYELAVGQLVAALALSGGEADRDGALGVGNAREVFKDAVAFCLRTGRVEKALEWLELSRDAALRRVFDPGKLQAQNPGLRKTLDEIKQAELQAMASKKALDQELAKPQEQRNTARVEALGKVAAHTDRELRQLMVQLNAKNPRMYQALSIKAEDIRALQASLPPGTVVLEYFLADDALYIFLIAKDSTKPRAFKVDVTAKLLEQHVFDWRASIAARNPVVRGKKRTEVLGLEAPAAHARTHELSQQLYNWLLGPVQAELAGVQTVLIVPYGPLYYLPIHALEVPGTGEKTQYALETMRIGYLSAATRFAVGHAARSGPRSLLAFGNPDGTLPGARTEVERLRAQAFPEAQVFYERDATKKRFLELAGQFKLIHLATHGVLEADATASHLKMAGEPLTVYDITGLEGLDGRTELVVLSACDTALQLGKSTGEELISVASAFATAGAPALVASLWEVDDEATSELMTVFYTLLRDGKDSAGPVDTLEALRRAQLHVLALQRDGKRPWAEPAYWAAFHLIGDFR